MYMCVCIYMCTTVKIREQLCGVSSVLPALCGFWVEFIL